MDLRRWAADESTSRSLGAWARGQRHALLVATFPDLDSMRVLDLGGTAHYWCTAPIRPESVVLLNPYGEESGVDWVRTVTGDACEPPAELRSDRFDLVFSNSTIEHVGGHERRQRFAESVRSLAPRAWVQTPNRYFPVEPHWMLPFGQFLPAGLRAATVRRWPIRPAGFPADDRRESLGQMLEVDLLSESTLAWYFPEARILRERILGLTKSLVAVLGEPG